MNRQELEKCRSRLENYLFDLLELMGRSERRHWAEVYVRGLIVDGQRKSIEPMANRMADGNVQAMQQFIGQSPWDHRPVRQRLAEKMASQMTPTTAWIIDDTGFPKKGRHSVGVAKQYSGTLGQVGNCQVAVSLHLAVDQACMPINYALYLPREWTDDQKRLARAGVPDEARRFKTKFELALELIDEALLWDIAKGVVVCDSDYGKANQIRRGLIERGLCYVAEVSAKNAVYDQPQKPVARRGRDLTQRQKRKWRSVSVKELMQGLPKENWQAIKWREGTKGALVSRFVALRVDPVLNHQKGATRPPRQWLLAEWPLDQPGPNKFWFSNLGPQTGLRRLVILAKTRWMVDQNYQQQKDELGLDHYEGRGWLGWHHHVTMNLISFGFLILETLGRKNNE